MRQFPGRKPQQNGISVEEQTNKELAAGFPTAESRKV